MILTSVALTSLSGSDVKTVPLRRCVSCRCLKPRSELWRVVRLATHQTLQLDTGMGRSAYVCRQRRCVQEAQKKNKLGRALRIAVPSSIYEVLCQRLESPMDLEPSGTPPKNLPEMVNDPVNL